MPNPRQAVRSRLTRARENPGQAYRDFVVASQEIFRQLRDVYILQNPDAIDNISRRLEDIRNSLTMLIPIVNDQSRTVMRRLVGIITEVVENIERITLEQENSSNLLVNIHQGFRGRPKLEVSEEQILFLREFSFSWRQIQHLLGISRSTFLRRRRELGLVGLTRSALTRLTDDELQRVMAYARRDEHKP